MSNYSFQAIDAKGAVVKGDIEANSSDEAANIIADKGYIPYELKEKKLKAAKSGLMLRINRKVKIADLIIFTKQFRSLFKAGVPLVRAFQVLEAQTQSDALKYAIASILKNIREGVTLSVAMGNQEKIFSPLYCSMIRAGEMSGTLPEALERLIYMIEHEGKIKSDIKSALQYPIMVTVALTGAFFFLLNFVVPSFANNFSKAGIDLPLPTQIAITLHHFVSDYWFLILACIIVVIFALRLWLKTENGKYMKDSLILRIPVIGPLFIKAAMSRFASIFGMLQSSGVPVMSTMKILSGVIGNAAISREFDRVRDYMGEGQGIAVTLQSAKYFTPMVIDMVAIGEETGNLEEMLHEVSLHYDDEVSYAVKGLSEFIGPILIVGLAAVVGFFALAIFMPMWDMTKMTKF
ncbi:MAG: type II secretion system F family protein [Proteobacteria bacterium]|nr:type II secretion system F family protein [Pseudomonadota bacterium]